MSNESGAWIDVPVDNAAVERGVEQVQADAAAVPAAGARCAACE